MKEEENARSNHADEQRRTAPNPSIERFMNFVLSNDPRRWLILIVLLGFALRFIVASNVPPVSDESGSITHAIGFSKLAPLSQMVQAQIWYYLTDSYFVYLTCLF